MAARGRGAFFKAKYGGGGRGRGGGNDSIGASALPRGPPVYRHITELAKTLQRINGQSYGSYKQLMGSYFMFPEAYEHPCFTLAAEHIQADPFAPPSRFRAFVSMSRTEFPANTYSTRTRRVALCDYITRRAHFLIRVGHWDQAASTSSWSGPKGGDFTINAPSQQVLERNSCLISQNEKGEEVLELRFSVGLPAAGRTILGDRAAEILTVNLPELVKKTMLWKSLDQAQLMNHIMSVEDQEALRSSLEDKGLIAFIGNGSILPRASGASALPMTGEHVVPFRSPPSLELTITTPNRGPVIGMGIPKGITLLTGGGFHGKSTVLEAIELGIYNYVPGDGRETVVTNEEAVKIRSEDGRNVVSTDITPFIGILPGDKTTDTFTSEDASGSTSMAANIQEALELGAKTLLLDEDSCATNLLIRDQRMQALIQVEPITPLVAKAQALFKDYGVSTMLVIGGCGDYLNIADLVIGMENYIPYDITQKARSIASSYPINIPAHRTYGSLPKRIPLLPPFHTDKSPVGRDTRTISTQLTPDIDIGDLEQFVEVGQVKTSAEVLRYIALKAEKGLIVDGIQKKALTMLEWKKQIEDVMDRGGMDALHTEQWRTGDMVRVRGFEIMAVVNRVRGLKVKNP